MIRDALAVGINTYSYERLSSLTAPAQDAEAIAKLLERYGQFNVKRLPSVKDKENNTARVGQKTSVTLTQLEEAIVQLFKPEGKNAPDTALLYFSGHGLRKNRGIQEGFLATSDVNPDLGNWGIRLKWLRELLQDSEVKQQIIWLDCCYSGELLNFAEADPGDRGKGRDRCFIAASREFEVAYQAIGSNHSVLTEALLQGLDPQNSAGAWVTNYTLINFLHHHWANYPQRPLFANSGSAIDLTRVWLQQKEEPGSRKPPITQVTPGFDIKKYQNSLQFSYGFLKLSAISIKDDVEAVELCKIFIEPSVREGLPPLRYDLPLDVKRQLQEQGRLDADLSPDVLEHYRNQYFQQPPQKVLAAMRASHQTVILGYPGAGKSSLLQFIALEWVEGKTEELPLLIELREYAIAQSKNFLEFLHRGRGADWQFDQQQLDQHLQSHPTLVMFDGLDEVFDPTFQSNVINDIIRFTQHYPQARILITSRIIGYNPDRLKQAGFHHFTIQPLNHEEIHKFINSWYKLTLGDTKGNWLAHRLADAIAQSKPIQNLADNPLLLTMMAILNQEKELPRNRVNLYDETSQVLLTRWEVDHKRLKLPINTIDRREKQEILCLVAYKMQASDQGLKTNLITAEGLTDVVTGYLKKRDYSDPREKARQLIEQLRERNFILCYRGADTYGFVHRTFLEYFCAVEIVRRFKKQQTLTFERLRDEIFEPHCQDETWHEVLRLVASMIDVSLAEAIVEYLLEQGMFSTNLNCFLAAKCVADIGQQSEIYGKHLLTLMNFFEDFSL